MKTKCYLLIGLLVFSGIVWSQNENRQSKKAAKEAKVKKMVESGRFQVTMNQAYPMRGRMISLTPEYTLALAKDSAISYLPYFGRAYSAPLNSEGGIKFAELVRDKKISFNAKKGSYILSFKVQAKEDTYRFFITVWLNGTATVNVTSNNRQGIDFSGEVLLPEP
jgi:archaellum component FlaF (FlaF/FlaG flagellin family)